MDIRQINIRHLRSNISLVGQEPTLFNLTIEENIAYGLKKDEVSEKRIVDAARLANIHDFVESLPEVSVFNWVFIPFRDTKRLLVIELKDCLEVRNKDWQSLEQSFETQRFSC